MVKVRSKALNEEIEVGRIIGHIKGTKPGPTVVFIGGLHGNETSGVFALNSVIEKLTSSSESIAGDVYAIAGNLSALNNHERFLNSDLNRIWDQKNIQTLGQRNSTNPELDELHELLSLTHQIIDKHTGPFYFIDLHTTSGETEPFLTVNDTVMNRKFSNGFHLPIILGIEEFVEGTYLNYVNYLGYVAIGFESGQHDDIASIKYHESFIYLCLERTDSMHPDDIPKYQLHSNAIQNSTLHKDLFYEIRRRFQIDEDKVFKMKEGYINFQTIKKKEYLADYNGIPILSDFKGKIFLPFYQKKGEDGFFIIRHIPLLALNLSIFLRKINFDHILTCLPGVRWASAHRDMLLVKRSIAWFFARGIFHLLGYSVKLHDENYLCIRNRERRFKKEDYLNERWYSSGFH